MEYSNNEKLLLSRVMNIRCPLCGSSKIAYTPEPAQVISYPYIDTEWKKIDMQKLEWINCLYGECQECGYIILRRLDTVFNLGRLRLRGLEDMTHLAL